ncbi:MAG: hypothetical protein JRJ84_23590 [Deltaproteobacteria bacterium]|nr:hypothetical protein [Deltaproteobacteria bacterium]
MGFFVVAPEDLTRIAGRVVAAIRSVYPAEHWSVARFEHNTEYVLGSGGVLLLGDFLAAKQLVAQAGARFDRFGVRWAMEGARACVVATPIKPSRKVLAESQTEIIALKRIGAQALEAFDFGDSKWGGAQFAGAFLDPGQVAQETEILDDTPFSPDRLFWERQYTIGIARFFLDGFQAWGRSAPK